ncbi:MAG: hypothetical protein Tsb0016_22460 [Sphingomonadales bacterium]
MADEGPEEAEAADPADEGPPAGHEQRAVGGFDLVDFGLSQCGLLRDAGEQCLLVELFLVRREQAIEHIANGAGGVDGGGGDELC